jgi:hypothetical protein
MRHCRFVVIVDMFDLRNRNVNKRMQRTRAFHEHGVSPTQSVYQFKLLVLQVVFPCARTIARDQLNAQTSAMHARHVEHIVSG